MTNTLDITLAAATLAIHGEGHAHPSRPGAYAVQSVRARRAAWHAETMDDDTFNAHYPCD